MISSFWQMGGYALYVWSAYGIVFGALGLLWVLLVKEHRLLTSKIRALHP